MKKIIGLRQLRENTSEYIKSVKQGNSFIVMRRSEPLFKISPINENADWEEVIDFTKIKKGGIEINDLLSRI